MKKLNVIISFVALFTLFSCEEDFLDRTAYDKKVQGNFYRTPTDALQGLTAVYDVLQYSGWTNIHMVSEVMSDNCPAGGGATDDENYLIWDGWLQGANLNLNTELWQKYYQGIYRANLFLESIENVDWGDKEDLTNQYTAEVKFLRAYYYFDLVRIFENIILMPELLPPDVLTKQTQADPKDVYALIGEDLKFAIENLPSDKWKANSPEAGRVTKWAAESLFARVYLFYTGYYGESELAGVNKAGVIAYLDDVINNSGHDLMNNFADLWEPDANGDYNENNIETVFAIKFTHLGLGDWDLQDGNRWQVMIGIRGNSQETYGGGWGFGVVNTSLWDDWDDNDPRKRASIISWDEEDSIVYPQNDQRQYTGYHWRKYLPRTNEEGVLWAVARGGDMQIDNYTDDMVIRFADVLLMAAELKVDSDNGAAQKHLDAVRKRAYGDNSQSVPATLQNILDERRWELCLEGHRYYDVLRQGMSEAETILESAEPWPVDFRPVTGGFLAIPQDEINVMDGNLVQNPGW